MNPVAFNIFGFGVRWYGLAYLATFIIGLNLTKYCLKFSKSKITKSDLDQLLNFIIAGVILGGRIGQFLFYEKFSREILYIWHGGMSFHGGVIGVTFSIILFCLIYKKSMWAIADLVAMCTPIGCFLGRLANYINGEVIGTKISPILQPYFNKICDFERYPVVFLEAFFEGIVLFFILFANLKRKKEGITSAMFLIWYGIFRFILEFIREPSTKCTIFDLTFTTAQMLSLGMIFIGILIYKRKNR